MNNGSDGDLQMDSINDWIDEECDLFEEAFQIDHSLRIESFIATRQITGQARDAVHELEKALIQLEMDLRLIAGEKVYLSEYFTRYHHVKHNVISAWEAILQLRSDLVSLAELGENSHVSDLSAGFLGICRVSSIPKQLANLQIDSQIGNGSFGFVFLAVEHESGIKYAIKFPRASLEHFHESANRLLHESHLAADLVHPGILQSHGFESEQDFLFLRQRFIEGISFDELIQTRPTVVQIVELFIELAEAISYAHQNGVYHRDLKPNNILLDKTGRPHVTDFGLALLSHQKWEHSGERSGSPSYMAPEQIEGHADDFDGRTDLWSLGVIFYETLTGKKPFNATDVDVLFEDIRSQTPLSIREYRLDVNSDLEKICLKCLEKDKHDRYETVGDFTAALKSWKTQFVKNSDFKSESKISLRGLRPFQAEDHQSFVRLLPGEFDSNGLPRVVLNWKHRLENREIEDSLPVSIIYGKSGAGKSSFVKAGIIPAINPAIVNLIYIESRIKKTEQRICQSISKRLGIAGDIQHLATLLETIKTNHNSKLASKKLVIVLDQFEQLLYRHWQSDCWFEDAFKLADGINIHFLLVVRDDFWVSISRLMNKIDCPLDDRVNIGLVDLFDIAHAKKVLIEYGKAFGTIGENGPTSKQQQFVDKAAKMLAHEGYVVCMQLVLFAELVRDKTWDASTLGKIGGKDGIGETLLESTLSNARSNRKFNSQVDLVKTILAELLPQVGSPIRENSVSLIDLSKAVERRPDDPEFQSAISLLETDLKLITAVEFQVADVDEYLDNGNSVGKDEETKTTDHVATYNCVNYQLTHDYLVSPIRNWLVRKSKESWKGRAELKFTDNFELWNRTKHSRHLLGFSDQLAAEVALNKRRLQTDRLEFLKKSRRRNLFNCSIVFFAITAVFAIVLVLLERNNRTSSLAQLDAYYVEPLSGIPKHLETLTKKRSYIEERVLRDLNSENEKKRILAALAYLRFNPKSELAAEKFIDDLSKTNNGELLRASLPELLGANTFALEAINRKVNNADLSEQAIARLTAIALYLGDHSHAKLAFQNVKDPTIACLVCDEVVHHLPDLNSLSKYDACSCEECVFRRASIIALASEKKPELITSMVRTHWQAFVDQQLHAPTDPGLYAVAKLINKRWNKSGTIPNPASSPKPNENRNWFVTMPDSGSQRFIALGPDTFKRSTECLSKTKFHDKGNPFGVDSLATIDSRFWICECELTYRQISSFFKLDGINALKSKLSENRPEVIASAYSMDRPLEYVSFDDVDRLLTWLNQQKLLADEYYFDIPTADEWEYACRAGSLSLNYWGGTNTMHLRDDYAIVSDATFNREPDAECILCAPGTRLPNRFGISDMIGNVSEESWPHPEGTTLGGHKLEDFMVVRGGNAIYPDYCWASFVGTYPQHVRSSYQGIRLVIRKK